MSNNFVQIVYDDYTLAQQSFVDKRTVLGWPADGYSAEDYLNV